jgi:hypothetical protein
MPEVQGHRQRRNEAGGVTWRDRSETLDRAAVAWRDTASYLRIEHELRTAGELAPVGPQTKSATALHAAAAETRPTNGGFDPWAARLLTAR